MASAASSSPRNSSLRPDMKALVASTRMAECRNCRRAEAGLATPDRQQEAARHAVFRLDLRQAARPACLRAFGPPRPGWRDGTAGNRRPASGTRPGSGCAVPAAWCRAARGPAGSSRATPPQRLAGRWPRRCRGDGPRARDPGRARHGTRPRPPSGRRPRQAWRSRPRGRRPAAGQRVVWRSSLPRLRESRRPDEASGMPGAVGNRRRGRKMRNAPVGPAGCSLVLRRQQPPKEMSHAEDCADALVRQSGRGGRQLLCRHLPAIADHRDHPLRRRRSRAAKAA